MFNIGKVSICSFNEIKKFELTTYNRSIIHERLKKIKEQYLKNFKNTEDFMIHDFIHVGKIKGSEEYFILDGQHRIMAMISIYKDLYSNENLDEIYDEIDIESLKSYLKYHTFFVRKFKFNTTEQFVRMIHEINDRLSYTYKAKQEKVKEIFNNKMKEYMNINFSDITQKEVYNEDKRCQAGSFHNFKVTKFVIENEQLVEIFNSDIDDNNYFNMNKFFDMIKNFNDITVKELEPIFDKNNKKELNQILDKIYEITKNDNLKFSYNSKCKLREKYYKQVKALVVTNNFILSLLNNKNYNIWLQEITDKFLEETTI